MLRELDRELDPSAAPVGPGDGPEYSDGPGHQAAQSTILDDLRRLFGLALNTRASGLPPDEGVRNNRAQVVTPGVRPGTRRRTFPDVSYVGADGVRVNVEIDTTEARSRAHEAAMVRKDPCARYVFLIVDPASGATLSRRDYVPPARCRARRPPPAARPVPNAARAPLPAPRRPAKSTPAPPRPAYRYR